MSNTPQCNHQNTVVAELMRAVQSLTAVLHRAQAEQEKVEKKLNIYFSHPQDASFAPRQLPANKIPLETAPQVTAETKKA